MVGSGLDIAGGRLSAGGELAVQGRLLGRASRRIHCIVANHEKIQKKKSDLILSSRAIKAFGVISTFI
jgi:hypothetical protein